LSFSPDGTRLFTANSRSGSLSVIDPKSQRVLAEHDLGQSLSDVAALPNGLHLLAVDRAGDALLLLEFRDDSVKILERRSISPDPVSVVVSPNGGTVAVASQRSRRVTFFSLAKDSGPALDLTHTLDLPFSPHNLALTNNGSRLVVADAFGGKLAVVDPVRGSLESLRTLPAHNIRGLTFSPNGQLLAVSHQSIHDKNKTDFEDIHWGRILTNHVRLIRVEALLTPGSDADLLRGSRLTDLGSPGVGSGDPAGAVFDPVGGLVVALAGVDELALSSKASGYWKRIPVGRRPLAVALDPSGKTAFVADALDDTLSVVDTVTGLWLGKISLGARPPLDLIARGERLFFDAKLSHDGWMSCQTCHTDGQTSGLTVDTLGDGTYGAPKRTPSLLGVGATGPWTWTGSLTRLEDQVRKSIETTMRGRAPSDDTVAALTAYLRSLTPPPSIPSKDQHQAVARGREVFRSQRCADCHAGPVFTSASRYDVGLVDEVGNEKFNPPSLQGVGQRTPLLHDGRAQTLEDVFRIHKHPNDTELTPEDSADLAAFLKTL